jgi:hypothetical protein
MESKKINQLATELAPDLSDLTIIGDPTTGISKKITLSQMASLFTGTVEEYANLAAFPLVGVADTIYVAKDTNVIYRWDSTAYVVLSPNVIASLVFNDANGFDGNIALVGSVATLTITTALTTGSVGFIGASGALLQDNANFFWDDTNNRLGLGTNAPTTALDVFGSGIIGRINGTSTNNAYLGFASAGTNKWSVGNVQSDHRFRIFSEANSTELISVLQTGEFGIGIANPTTKFHIDGAASALIANLDANVSVAKSISFRSDNSNRINLEVSGTESGSNAGANFFIRRYSDAGSLIDTPFTITRSTGAITLATVLNGTSAIFSSTVNATNGLLIGNGGATASSNYIPKFTSASEIANSAIFDNGGNIGINNTNSYNKLDIVQTGSNNAVTGVGLKIASDAGNAASMAFSQSARGTAIIGMQAAASAPSNFVIGTDVTGNIIFKQGITGTDLSTGSARLTIGSTGAATFASTLQSASLTVSDTTSNLYLYNTFNSSVNRNWALTCGQGDLGDFNIMVSNAQNGNPVTAGSVKLNIQKNGTLLIGKISDTFTVAGYKLTSGGESYNTIVSSINTLHIYDVTNSVFRFYVSGTGTINATNTTISAISDVRLKENITDLEIGLEAIMALRPRKFDWKKESGNAGKNVRGFIAQEFEEIFPDLIDESINAAPEGEEPYKQIRQDLIPILVKGMQQQQAQIEELKALINK